MGGIVSYVCVANHIKRHAKFFLNVVEGIIFSTSYVDVIVNESV